MLPGRGAGLHAQRSPACTLEGRGDTLYTQGSWLSTLAGQRAGLHAPGSQMAHLQGKEPACTPREAGLHACRARGWLADVEEPNCRLAGQGAGVHAQGSRLARSGGDKAPSRCQAQCQIGEHPHLLAGILRRPRATPRWPVAGPCRHVGNLPLAQTGGSRVSGGRSPPRPKLPGWVLGAGDVPQSRCWVPRALVNVEFVFLLQLCFSTHIALPALIPFLFFPWKYRQHPQGGYNLKYRCIMQIKPKPCPRVTGSDSFIPASPTALACTQRLLQPD